MQKGTLLIKNKQTDIKADEGLQKVSFPIALFFFFTSFHGSITCQHWSVSAWGSPFPCPPTPFPPETLEVSPPLWVLCLCHAFTAGTCPAELWKWRMLRQHFPHCVGQWGAGIDADRNSTVLGKIEMLKMPPWPNANFFLGDQNL